MNDLELLEKLLPELEQTVKAILINGTGGHDFDHTLRVRRNALALAAELAEANVTVVAAASLLHDMARPEEDASNGRVEHSALGAERGYALLRELGVGEALAQQVALAIRRHRYRSANAPESLEERIIFDADKLDSLGATGIGRAFLFAGRTGARLHNRAEEALNGAAYSVEDTAYREYLVKLRRLPELLYTEPARRRARRLKAFMDDFFQELNCEVYPE